MTEHSAEKDAATWRDYCKHYGPCDVRGSGDWCVTPTDPAYVADMEARYPTRPIPPAEVERDA